VRWENRLVTIRTCFHDLGPSQTGGRFDGCVSC
jgi:hypothetical protein